jgi:hypothetical protein
VSNGGNGCLAAFGVVMIIKVKSFQGTQIAASEVTLSGEQEHDEIKCRKCLAFGLIIGTNSPGVMTIDTQ